ncbi:putative signal transducing protein [Vibrio sp. M260112]|uniref:putative signal transducing protein n=1 Tax=Vibrio sp. M260112 TaxID=3020895 RepID=UPI002F3FBB8D
MRLYSATTPPEAHIVCELLKSQQILCEVRGEGLFGLQGEIPFGENSEPYIWLFDEQQLAQAQAIIADFKRAERGVSWRCSECSEQNEAQFGLCWKCGACAP